MSQQSRAKQLRQQAAAAVQAKTDEIRNGIITEMLSNLYRAPLWFRLKWAVRIVRGDRRESLWMHWVIWTADWLLERFTRWIGRLDRCRLDHVKALDDKMERPE